LGVEITMTLAPLIVAMKVRTVPWIRGEVRLLVA
jgi:hypothetical protein